MDPSSVIQALGVLIALLGQGAAFYAGFSRLKVIVEMMLDRVKSMESDLKHIAILPTQVLAVNSQVEALNAHVKMIDSQLDNLDKRIILLKENLQELRK